MWDAERADGGEKLTRVPERDAGGEGHHVDEQQEDRGGPSRGRKASYLVNPSEEKLIKISAATPSLRGLKKST
jgi:hypothetical protein